MPILVFDLDSTLFQTEARNLRILHEFAEQHGGDFEGLREQVAGLTLSDMGWNVHSSLMERGLDAPDMIAALKKFWFERFFTDAYVAFDQPTAGSVDFVNRCHQLGGFIYYLTGRNVGGMEHGTVQALTDAGFPYWRGRTSLHLKPDFTTHDKVFKDVALGDIRSHFGRVVATFENEPGNANLFHDAFEGGLHFLLETIHSTEAEEPYAELIRISDFVTD
mgnify:CR=1 FL=1